MFEKLFHRIAVKWGADILNILPTPDAEASMVSLRTMLPALSQNKKEAFAGLIKK